MSAPGGGAIPMTGTAFEEALENAGRDWPVIALHCPVTFGPKKGPGRATCSCRRLDCESQGKHPRTEHGLKDASTDAGQLAEWDRRWPGSNYGILTGAPGPDVLDIDDEEGDLALGDLARQAGDPEMATDGPMVETARGSHMFFAAAGARNRTGIVPAVDWRGAGGYVVAPGSVHPSGHVYRWLPGLGADTPLEPPPAWLLQLVLPPAPPANAGPVTSRSGDQRAYGQQALVAEVGRLALAANGTRNDTLNRAAFSLGQLVGGGELEADAVVGALLTEAVRLGLGGHEAEATISSGMRRGLGLPRSRPA